MDLTTGAAYLGVVAGIAGVWFALEQSNVILALDSVMILTFALRMWQLQSWVNDHVAECDTLSAD